jgi:hypothetical protein
MGEFLAGVLGRGFVVFVSDDVRVKKLMSQVEQGRDAPR